MLMENVVPDIRTKNIILRESGNGDLEIDVEFSLLFNDVKDVEGILENKFQRNAFNLNIFAARRQDEFDEFIAANPSDRITDFSFEQLTLSKLSFEEKSDERLELLLSSNGREINLAPLNPNYFSLIYFISFNESYLQGAFGIDPSTLDAQRGTYSINSDLIFKNDELNGKAFAFVDKGGDVFEGKVVPDIEDGERIYRKAGGGRPARGGEKVRLIEVDNTKIQDLRPFTGQVSNKNNIDLKEIIKSEIKSVFEKEVKRDQAFKKKNVPEEYIGDGFLGLGKQKSLRQKKPYLIFSLAWKNILKDFSEFPQFVSGVPERFDLISKKSKIYSLEILRKRVSFDKVDTVFSQKTDIDQVPDEIRKIDLVATGADTESAGFQAGRGNFKEVNLVNIGNERRFFHFIDEEAVDLTYGEYAYVVKVSIKDGTREFLEEVQQKLSELHFDIRSVNDFSSDLRGKKRLAKMRNIEQKYKEVFRLLFGKKHRLQMKRTIGSLGNTTLLRRVLLMMLGTTEAMHSSVSDMLDDKNRGSFEVNNETIKTRTTIASNQPASRKIDLEKMLKRKYDADDSVKATVWPNRLKPSDRIFLEDLRARRADELSELFGTDDFSNIEGTLSDVEFSTIEASNVNLPNEGSILESFNRFDFTPVEIGIGSVDLQDVGEINNIQTEGLSNLEGMMLANSGSGEPNIDPDKNLSVEDIGVISHGIREKDNTEKEIGSVIDDVVTDQISVAESVEFKKDTGLDTSLPEEQVRNIEEINKLGSTPTRRREVMNFVRDNFDPELYEMADDFTPPPHLIINDIGGNSNEIIEIVRNIARDFKNNIEKMPVVRAKAGLIHGVDILINFDDGKPEWRTLSETDLGQSGLYFCRLTQRKKNNPAAKIASEVFRDFVIAGKYFLLDTRILSGTGAEAAEESIEEVENDLGVEITNEAKHTVDPNQIKKMSGN